MAGLSADAARVRVRLTGTLIAAPAIAASAASLTLAQAQGPATLAAASFVIFGACWLAGLFVAAHGREKLVGALSLLAGAGLTAVLVAMGGGLGSPLAILLLALVFEPWWIWRGERALAAGASAAAAAAVGAAMLVEAGVGHTASAAFWIPVLLYGASLAARLMDRPEGEGQTSASDELAAALDAVVLRLTGNGEVADASEKARDLMRLPPEMLLQQGLFERVHVADRVAYMCALSDLRNGATNRKLDLRLRLPSDEPELSTGAYEWFGVEMVRLGSEASECVAIFRRAQEFGELNARVAASEERAERAELLKSNFLASVSHELRTPLNAIIGFSDMLTHELYGRFADPRQKEHVALISEAGHHLLGVVNAILDVSKIEHGAYTIICEPFELDAAVKTSLSMVSVQAKRKEITIDVEMDPAIGTVDADPRAVRQMLINLLSNAVKFTPEGGTVTVGASTEDKDVRLWVRDTGIGIAAEDIGRLGQPFVQAGDDYTRRGDGTGLGLALVKGLAQLHGGSFTIESEIGAGTTATVILPQRTPHNAAADQATEMQKFKSGLDHGAFRKTA